MILSAGASSSPRIVSITTMRGISALLVLCLPALVAAQDSNCALEKERGTCNGFILRFYYDTALSKCKYFFYSGCGGNENNFEKLQDCQKHCGSEKAVTSIQTSPNYDRKTTVGYKPGNRCDHPVDKGQCKGRFVRWYFNKEEQQCETFHYGGCFGNGNNFASREECEAGCIDLPLNICLHPQNRGECNGDIQRWSYDVFSNTCTRFSYSGCGGNGNNFVTSAQCEVRCYKKPVLPTHCVPMGNCVQPCIAITNREGCLECKCPASTTTTTPTTTTTTTTQATTTTAYQPPVTEEVWSAYEEPAAVPEPATTVQPYVPVEQPVYQTVQPPAQIYEPAPPVQQPAYSEPSTADEQSISAYPEPAPASEQQLSGPVYPEPEPAPVYEAVQPAAAPAYAPVQQSVQPEPAPVYESPVPVQPAPAAPAYAPPSASVQQFVQPESAPAYEAVQPAASPAYVPPPAPVQQPEPVSNYPAPPQQQQPAPLQEPSPVYEQPPQTEPVQPPSYGPVPQQIGEPIQAPGYAPYPPRQLQQATQAPPVQEYVAPTQAPPVYETIPPAVYEEPINQPDYIRNSVAEDSSVCEMPKDPGHCNQFVTRWWYNSASRKCEEFEFGSCGGNGNNFIDRLLCEARCFSGDSNLLAQVPEKCLLPKDPGPCDGYHVVYFFNPGNMLCELLVYGGCGGNANRFESNELCVSSCKDIPEQTTVVEKPAVQQPQQIEYEVQTQSPFLSVYRPKVVQENQPSRNPQPQNPAPPPPVYQPTQRQPQNTPQYQTQTAKPVAYPAPATSTRNTHPQTTHQKQAQTTKQPSIQPVAPPQPQPIYTQPPQPPSSHSPPSYQPQPINNQQGPYQPPYAAPPAVNPPGLPTPQHGGLQQNYAPPSLIQPPPALGVPQANSNFGVQAGLYPPQPPGLFIDTGYDEREKVHVCPNGQGGMVNQHGSTILCLPGHYQCPPLSVCYFNGLDYFCCPNADDPYDRPALGGYGSNAASQRLGYASPSYKAPAPAHTHGRYAEYRQRRLKRQAPDNTIGNPSLTADPVETAIAQPVEERFLPPTVPRSNQKAHCNAPADRGPCKGSHLRWYYEASTDRCRLFYYGGCLGNPNSYGTKIHCEKDCVTVAPAGMCAGDVLPLGGPNPLMCGRDANSIGCPDGFYCKSGPPDVCCPGVEPVVLPTGTPPTPKASTASAEEAESTSNTTEVSSTSTEEPDNTTDVILAAPSQPQQPFGRAPAVQPPSSRPPAVVNQPVRVIHEEEQNVVDFQRAMLCPDGSLPLADWNAAPVPCRIGFNGTPFCPLGHYCALGVRPGAGVCCRLSFGPGFAAPFSFTAPVIEHGGPGQQNLENTLNKA